MPGGMGGMSVCTHVGADAEGSTIKDEHRCVRGTLARAPNDQLP